MQRGVAGNRPNGPLVVDGNGRRPIRRPRDVSCRRRCGGSRTGEGGWWLSDGTASLRARERAYRQYLRRGEPRAAALVALALALDHFHRLARSVGQGWLRRAERYLEGLPDPPERGWLYRLRFVVALAERKPEEAMEFADRALEIARRVGDTDLEALALQDRGRVLVALGQRPQLFAEIGVDRRVSCLFEGQLEPTSSGRRSSC